MLRKERVAKQNAAKKKEIVANVTKKINHLLKSQLSNETNSILCFPAQSII